MGVNKKVALFDSRSSVEETENLSSDMLLSGLEVVDNTLVGGEDDETELSGWENLWDKLLEVLELEVESWGDDTALVQSSVKVNDDLAGSGIVNNLELVDVTMLLHKSEELDDNLGDWSKENLTLGHKTKHLGPAQQVR